ncbi:MAG: hypothetical protein ACMXX7_02115 [Candidatus Woesearchaeota archaeon]
MSKNYKIYEFEEPNQLSFLLQGNKRNYVGASKDYRVGFLNKREKTLEELELDPKEKFVYFTDLTKGFFYDESSKKYCAIIQDVNSYSEKSFKTNTSIKDITQKISLNDIKEKGLEKSFQNYISNIQK